MHVKDNRQATGVTVTSSICDLGQGKLARSAYARAFVLKGIGMSVLQWSNSFTLGVQVMDETHQEFVDLLAQVVQASDAQLLTLWTALVSHTEAHFAREDRWMTDTGFSADNCHSTQHRFVLNVLREGEKRGQTGDLAVIRQMAGELGIWFPQHANAMDAALAQHLQQVGYDMHTGQVSLPGALPAEKIAGCHGTECSPHTEAQDKLATA
jgi:hemerythrin-like metal-binding protein